MDALRRHHDITPSALLAWISEIPTCTISVHATIVPYANVFKELEPPVTVVMVVCDIEAMARGCVDVVGCADERMMDAADVCRGGGVEGMVEKISI